MMFKTEATPQEKGLQMLTTDEKLFPDPCDSSKECAAVKVSSPRDLFIRRFLLLIVIFITLGGLGLGITFALSASSQCVNHLGINYEYPLKYDPSFVSEKKLNQTYNIVLFGDSLINFPFQYYELSEKISAYLPDFSVEIQNYGIDSNRIGDMRRRVDNMLAETTDTYAVILFWDSDVSDINEYGVVPDDEINAVREAYKLDLNYVLNTIMTKKPDAFVALAGPEMLGEGPLFSPVTPSSYYRKLRMLSRYVKINQQICESNSIPYINMHHAFRTAIPKTYYGYQGCITTDGEHPNENGATIIAKMFSEILLEQILS